MEAIDRFTSDGTERRDPEPLAAVDVIVATETAIPDTASRRWWQ